MCNPDTGAGGDDICEGHPWRGARPVARRKRVLEPRSVPSVVEEGDATVRDARLAPAPDTTLCSAP
jgi:hypothetical protein